MNTTTATHETHIVAAGNGHRAVCTCGWNGGRRVYAHDARRQATEHVTRSAAE